MTEYWALCRCGRMIEEQNRPWNSIIEIILRIGLKLNGQCVADIAIPDDYKGLIQCKLAKVVGNNTDTVAHIIGYVDKDDKNCVTTYNYNTGELIENSNGLDFKPHTIMRH